MEVTERTTIQEALEDAYTYDDYIQLVEDLLDKGRSTGNTQNDDMLNYSSLNLKRMQRWNKKGKIDEELQARINKAERPMTWIVLTEGWCGDASHTLPFINKLSELSENIDLKIVLRDDHDDLMNMFLTNGSKSIPKLIALDPETHDVLFTWGPRAEEPTQMVRDYKAEHGKIDADFKEQLQKWYNKDKGRSVAGELTQLVEEHQS